MARAKRLIHEPQRFFPRADCYAPFFTAILIGNII